MEILIFTEFHGDHKIFFSFSESTKKTISRLSSKIKDRLTSIIDLTKSILKPGPKVNDFNFTSFSVQHRKGNLSYIGMHLTIYDDNDKCSLDNFGSKAKVFWLWQTFRCTPLFLNSQWTNEYYFWSDSQLNMMCEDSNCQNCLFKLNDFDRQDKKCYGDDQRNASVAVGKPLIYSWQTSKIQMSIVANVFFGSTFCTFYTTYIEPQVSKL